MRAAAPRDLHTLAWLAWLAAALAPAALTRNPFVLAAGLAGVLVALARGRREGMPAGWGAMLRLGLLLAAYAVLIEPLVAGTGDTVLFHLPRAEVALGPARLGLGGPVALESVVYGLCRGLALFSLLAAFAAFTAGVDPYRLVRRAPRFLDQSGAVVSIALTFIPRLTAAWRELREARALRGLPDRGARDLVPRFVALLSEGLERSLDLAEAMEARGFGGPGRDRHGRARELALAGSLAALLAGAALRALRPPPAPGAWAGPALLTAGALGVVAALAAIGRGVGRTRHRPEAWSARDSAVVAAAALSGGALATTWALAPERLAFYAYPKLAMPPFDAALCAALLLLGAPGVVAARRRATAGRPYGPSRAEPDRSTEDPPSSPSTPTGPSCARPVGAALAAALRTPDPQSSDAPPRAHPPPVVPSASEGPGRGERTRAGALAEGEPAHAPPSDGGRKDAVSLAGLSYTYPGSSSPALADLSLTLPAGSRLLVVGPSGSGKSTLLRCLYGLVPHFHGGRLEGDIRVAGRDPVAVGPRGMAGAVGFVVQDPEAQFVAERVDDELAFALENLGVPAGEIGRRIEATLGSLGLAGFARRRLATLSGGERQRVALAGVLVAAPAVLVLDEPTSQLDPAAAGEVLALLARLQAQRGLTVVLTEHRLERVARFAQRVCLLDGPGRPAVVGRPEEVLGGSRFAPPVARLARRLGVEPVPLAVEEAGAVVARLDREEGNGEEAGWAAVEAGRAVPGPEGRGPAAARDGGEQEPRSDRWEPLLVWSGVSVSFPDSPREALSEVHLEVAAGERVALLGASGAGKTTLLKVAVGLVRPAAGGVLLAGFDPAGRPLGEVARVAGLVPQNPRRLLFAESVAEEVAATRRARGLAEPEGDDPLLERLGIAALAGSHPADLSGGERQRTALAAVLAGRPRLLLLDEPTRGLDEVAKEALAELLRELAGEGVAVVMATHDVELAARFAERAVLLGGGRIVADGPVAEVMAAYPRWASQAARIDARRARPAGAVTEDGLLRRADPTLLTQPPDPRPGNSTDA